MTDAISVFAFITTIVFSISQFYIVYIIKREEKLGKKNTSLFSILSCLIYQLIWFIYYKKKEDKKICWCYLVGIFFSFICASTYLFYYSKDLKKDRFFYLFLYIFINADLIFEIWLIERDILDYDEESKSRKNLVKVFACCFNAFMYITPGFNIFKFFTELNFGYNILPISIIGLINSLTWFLYGIISDDDNNNNAYIYTNIVGMIICAIQIILYLVIKEKSEEEKEIDNNKLLNESDINGSKKKKKDKKKKIKKDEENDILDII